MHKKHVSGHSHQSQASKKSKPSTRHGAAVTKQKTASQGSHSSNATTSSGSHMQNSAAALQLPDKASRSPSRMKKSKGSDEIAIDIPDAEHKAEPTQAAHDAHAHFHTHFAVDEGAADEAEDRASLPEAVVSKKTNATQASGRSKTQRNIVGAAMTAARSLKEFFAADIDLEVVSKSPQIAVLWGQQEHKRVHKILEQHNMSITRELELPENDRYLFIAERSKNFMDRLKRGGSAAAELEAMRLEFDRAISLQKVHSKQGRGTDYWMWPLHDAKFNRILLLRAFTADHAQHDKIQFGYHCIYQFAERIGVWLGMTIQNGELLTIIQSHFGCDVAIAFLFTLHHIFSLWVLFFPCLAFHILKSSVDLDQYRKLWSPIFQFGILFPWSLSFAIQWKHRVMWASRTWRADILEDDDAYVNDANKEFRPIRSDTLKKWLNVEDNPAYYPHWLRAVRTLLVVPLLLLDVVFMAMVLAFVFWFEMWIVFEWGRCAEINHMNGNNDCQGADVEHGFFGGLVEAVPGLIEGILFELILALSKALARFAVRLQNWHTETQKELAYITQLVFFELVGKFGWICTLAVVFVPDWVVSETKRNDDVFVYNEASCSDAARLSYDTRFFNLFGIPEQSLSCLKTRTQYDTRLALFEIAVAAPFFVAQIVSMAIKTLVPSLVVRFRACFPNDHGRVHGCYCRCCRFLLRFLSCACLFDIEAVGVDECNYIYGGDCVGEEIFNLTMAAPGEKGRPPASAWQTTLESQESLRKIDEEIKRDSEIQRASLLQSGNPAAQDQSGAARPSALLRAASAGSGNAPDPEKVVRGDRTLMTAWAEGVREAFVSLDENLETGMHFFWVISFAAFYPFGVCLAVLVFIFDVRGDLFRLTIIQKRNFRKSPKASLVMLQKFMKFAVGSGIVFNVGACFVTYQQMSRWFDKKRYHEGLWGYLWELMGICCIAIISLIIVQMLVNCIFHTGLAEKLEARKQARREQTSDHMNGDEPIHVASSTGHWQTLVRSKDALKKQIAHRLRGLNPLETRGGEERPFVGAKIGKRLDTE